MRDLFIALKALYDATVEATFSATPEYTQAQVLAAAVALRAYSKGGLHLGTAPHGTDMPHVTMSPTADTTSGTAGAVSGVRGVRYLDGKIVTLTIWAPRYGLDAGLAALKNLCKVFDNQCATFAGGGGIVLCIRRRSGIYFELPEPEGGYGIPADYEYRFV